MARKTTNGQDSPPHNSPVTNGKTRNSTDQDEVPPHVAWTDEEFRAVLAYIDTATFPMGPLYSQGLHRLETGAEEWLFHLGLNPHHHAVLARIRNRAQMRDGYAWESQTNIGKAIGLGRTVVNRTIRDLLELGIVAMVRPTTATPQGTLGLAVIPLLFSRGAAKAVYHANTGVEVPDFLDPSELADWDPSLFADPTSDPTPDSTSDPTNDPEERVRLEARPARNPGGGVHNMNRSVGVLKSKSKAYLQRTITLSTERPIKGLSGIGSPQARLDSGKKSGAPVLNQKGWAPDPAFWEDLVGVWQEVGRPGWVQHQSVTARHKGQVQALAREVQRRAVRDGAALDRAAWAAATLAAYAAAVGDLARTDWTRDKRLTMDNVGSNDKLIAHWDAAQTPPASGKATASRVPPIPGVAPGATPTPAPPLAARSGDVGTLRDPWGDGDCRVVVVDPELPPGIEDPYSLWVRILDTERKGVVVQIERYRFIPDGFSPDGAATNP